MFTASLLYDKSVDADADGQVTVDELAVWIRHVQRVVMHSDVREDWEEFSAETQRSGVVSWDEYADVTYDGEDEEDDENDGAVIEAMFRVNNDSGVP